MDEYYRMAAALPAPLAGELSKLSEATAATVQEIRLRTGQPVLFTIQGRLFSCMQYLPRSYHAAYISQDLLRQCFLHLCRHSVYAYEEELAQGFFTVEGGNRIGVAGNWNGGHFPSVTSLNLRVARQVTCQLPPEVRTYLSSGAGGLLVAGPPGSGKTTFLRTLVQYLCEKDEILCVVDERCELMMEETERQGKISPSRGCDVYSRCSKADGIHMALRCMNPRYIVCDELGTEQDTVALQQGVASGVAFLASVHCDTPEGLQKKPQIVHLLKTGAFPAAVFLDGREKPGKVSRWIQLQCV